MTEVAQDVQNQDLRRPQSSYYQFIKDRWFISTFVQYQSSNASMLQCQRQRPKPSPPHINNANPTPPRPSPSSIVVKFNYPAATFLSFSSAASPKLSYISDWYGMSMELPGIQDQENEMFLHRHGRSLNSIKTTFLIAFWFF